MTDKGHKIRTMSKRKLNLEACIGKPWSHRNGKTQPPRKAAASAAAILPQYFLSQCPFFSKKSPRRTEFELLFLDARITRGIRLGLASPSVSQIWLDTMTKMNEKHGATHWDGVLSVLTGKFRNQLKKEFTWLHCLYLGSIKTKFAIWKDENGE